MTFSILARDPETGALGGATATGNLCVGGWVLRGSAGIGISSSQGHYPSTLWGEQVLLAIAEGAAPPDAIESIVSLDRGRETRQLMALNQEGDGGVFSGSENIPEVSEAIEPDFCAGGNMLANAQVIDAVKSGYVEADGSFSRRLFAGLVAGAEAGGDERGLMSAAILIVAIDFPPINLRVDYSEDPLRDLSTLIDCVEDEAYANWMRVLPTGETPEGEL